MEYKRITDLNYTKERAIIINVGTKLLSTLALMSAIKYTNMPILLIDCYSKDKSYEFFLKLMESHKFDLLSAELREHGEMINWIFLNIPTENVLLIDSDIEILGDLPIKKMKEAITDKDVFGSGFIHEGAWMIRQKMKYAFYEERAWIPLVFFKKDIICKALKHGWSFCAKKVYNDFPESIFISRILAKRLYLPIVRNLKLSWLNNYRKEIHGIKPAMIYYDTGALMYQYLKNSTPYKFSAIPWEINWEYILHFHGVTRLQLNALGRDGTRLRGISDYIKNRLKDEYFISFDV